VVEPALPPDPEEVVEDPPVLLLAPADEVSEPLPPTPAAVALDFGSLWLQAPVRKKLLAASNTKRFTARSIPQIALTRRLWAGGCHSAGTAAAAEPNL
jgi:hypothetical protein